MSGFKEPSFADRQKASLDSRKNLLKKFHSKPGPDDSSVLQRRAEREAHAADRATRVAAKAEQKARDAEAATEQLVREKAEASAKETALEAERKAARDARYAARKGRGKKKG